MGGGGGGHTPSHTTQTIQYASYIEDKHSSFLDEIQAQRITAVADNPFDSYLDVEIDVGFFGIGFTLASFSSLYDMYGKFMSELDICDLYDQVFEKVVNSPEINNLVSAESALMDDDIDTNSLPRIDLGSRDINANMSSSFIIAKAIPEDAKIKSLNKFSAQLKYNLIPVAQSVWQTHLEWNKCVVGMYSEIMKFYFSTKADIDEINYAMAAKKALWPFTVLDFERAALGALQGATVQKTDVAGASTVTKVLSGALSGAAMGATVGGGWGAAGGTVLGIGAALTS